jgi:HEPN domain-containing protein
MNSLVFSSQQAAEKAVKAAFQKLSAEAWGHSVSDLLQELSKRHNVSRELLDGALELDKPISLLDIHMPIHLVLLRIVT